MRKRNVIVLAAMGLSLVACGSGDGAGDGVASLGTAAGTGEAEGAAEDADGVALEAPEDLEDAMALFRECMTDQGIEMPEGAVVAGGSGDEMIAVGGAPVVISNDGGPDGEEPPQDAGDDQGAEDDGDEEARVGPPPIDVEEFQAANEACRGHLENAAPAFDLTPEQEAAMEDARLEFDQCMADQGIEMPEMPSGADDIGVHIEEFEEGEATPPPIDFEEMEAASKVCAAVYDQYPELEDVFGEGASGAPVFQVAEAGEP